jgi:hypothetical protein
LNQRRDTIEPPALTTKRHDFKSQVEYDLGIYYVSQSANDLQDNTVRFNWISEPNVRYGSKADPRVANADVRFVPGSDIRCVGTCEPHWLFLIGRGLPQPFGPDPQSSGLTLLPELSHCSAALLQRHRGEKTSVLPQTCWFTVEPAFG